MANPVLTFRVRQMIPERNYLRAMLPSILGADKVGLVKASHGFINLPQRLSQPKSTLMTATETPR